MPASLYVRVICARPSPRCAQPWEDPVCPHGAHLAGRTREGDDDPSVGSLHPPAGRGAVLVGDRQSRGDDPGLLQVHLRERDAAAGPQAAEPRLQVAVDETGLAAQLSDRLAREIVGRGPETTGGDDEVGTIQTRRHGVADDLAIVGKGGDPSDPDAVAGQRARQLTGVRVARLADRDLGADREEFGDEQPSDGRVHG